MSSFGGPPATIDRLGHPFRHFQVAVSAGAMALAWARQEAAPHGAAVLVDHEINALGRLGQPWGIAAAQTLTCAVVLRPDLVLEDVDVPWLLGGLAVVGGVEAATGVAPATWWPDLVVDQSDRPVAGVLCEAQMAPGRVRSAVVTLRIDMDALGIEGSRRDDLLTSVLDALDNACAQLGDETESAAAAYQHSCALVGRRVKLRLRPHGETRGEVDGVDSHGRLQLRSATGMVERITVDMLRDLVIV